MKHLTCFVFTFSALAWSAALPSPLIGNIPGRTVTSLDGPWHVIVDPYETGLHARYYENATPQARSGPIEFNFEQSETLHVPYDWNMQKERLFFYEGPVWYKRWFTYRLREHTRVFVYFGAANYCTRVYLNGKPLGEHEGGFTPFNFEMTSQLADGDNFLVVEVNNTRRADGVPALNTDWWNYGGLTRDVLLVETSETFVRDYSVQLAKGTTREVAGWVQLDGASPEQPVRVEIPEAGVRKTFTPDANGHVDFHFPAKVELWSPQNPKLYDVVVSTGADTLHDAIGFRSIEVKGTQILLNGKPIFLRGISMHEEAPLRGGRAFSPQDAQTLLGWAKELQCNFVRLTHYPHNENEIRLADKLGLLVWSEIPVYWDIAWKNPATLANAEAQLRDMIVRDHNRASVIFWSMSNETPVDPERTVFLQKLVEDARQLDPTRLITSALNHVTEAGPEKRILDDPLGESLDVLGLNEYLGWYFGRPEDADRWQWESKYAKPLIVSEFGGDALYGKHGDASTRWTEEYQANLYVHQLAMIRRIPGFVGLSPWVLMDFHSPRRVLPGIQDYFNRKGLISNTGQHKQAFSVLQKFYGEMKETGPTH
ncbi:MAG TPA: glycoside hydrolase family 2 TIM barrel-domain containing protein [Terriglobales bacterium]|nr:glycoside hydrolase family 2 TIM barrel-domain containing protein [Terriglobales bacterium]